MGAAPVAISSSRARGRVTAIAQWHLRQLTYVAPTCFFVRIVPE